MKIVSLAIFVQIMYGSTSMIENKKPVYVYTVSKRGNMRSKYSQWNEPKYFILCILCVFVYYGIRRYNYKNIRSNEHIELNHPVKMNASSDDVVRRLTFE